MSYQVPPLGHDHFTIVDLEQSSDAWLAWRRTGLGSSDAAAVLGESPWKSRRALFDEKLVEFHGHRAPITTAQFQAIRKGMAEREAKNDSAKNRGKKLEPVARAEFEALTGLSMPAVCGHHAKKEHLKVSLDGWHAGRKEFLEVKCPNQRAHGDALDGRVPIYYVPQLLHQFLVPGATAGWYQSFHDKYPPGQRVAVVPVTPATARGAIGYDGKYDAPLADLVAALGAAEDEFWECVVTGVYRELGFLSRRRRGNFLIKFPGRVDSLLDTRIPGQSGPFGLIPTRRFQKKSVSLRRAKAANTALALSR